MVVLGMTRVIHLLRWTENVMEAFDPKNSIAQGVNPKKKGYLREY